MINEQYWYISITTFDTGTVPDQSLLLFNKSDTNIHVCLATYHGIEISKVLLLFHQLSQFIFTNGHTDLITDRKLRNIRLHMEQTIWSPSFS